MSTSGTFVPGVFSQVGRSTAFEVDSLKQHLNLETAEEGADGHDSHTKAATKKGKGNKGLVAGNHQDDIDAKKPGGDLARAIAEKLFPTGIEAESDKAAAVTDSQPLTSSFLAQGIEGRWATKHAACQDIGALNRRNEERPAPGWYKVKHESVLLRYPSWDIAEHPKQQPRPRPADKEEPSASFLTGIDPSNEEETKALTARQRAMLRDVLGLHPDNPTAAELQKYGKVGGSAMALASPRGALGKIGRNHVLANEVSCAGETDLLEQDIKGYPKMRYPEWDFNAYAARKPLIPEDAMGEPGKYDVNLDSVKTVPKNGIGFGKALPRSVCVSTMGYSAPPSVLHPESKRTRGLLPDRSTAKNSVRRRVTHVNDFDREMARPPLLTGAANVYHDESDPVVCARVHDQDMKYDATTADIVVTHRRDLAPDYSRMLGRGRDAVQGVRSLSSDLGVRGSVGLGFKETKNDLSHSVEQREARAADGTKKNPHTGPRFDHTALNLHTDVSERIFRGKPPVQSGAGARSGPLKKSRKDHPMVQKFQRSVSLPGFERYNKLGGTRDVLGRNRVSVPVEGWAAAMGAIDV